MTPYLEQLTGGPLNGEVCDGHIGTDRQADRHIDRQTDRQTNIQSDRHKMMTNPRLNANSNSHLVLYLLAA